MPRKKYPKNTFIFVKKVFKGWMAKIGKHRHVKDFKYFAEKFEIFICFNIRHRYIYVKCTLFVVLCNTTSKNNHYDMNVNGRG